MITLSMHNNHHHQKCIHHSIVRTPQVFRPTAILERVSLHRSYDSRYSPTMTQSYFTLKSPMPSSQRNRKCCRRRTKTFTTSKRYRTPGALQAILSIPMKPSQRAMRKFLFVSLQSTIVSRAVWEGPRVRGCAWAFLCVYVCAGRGLPVRVSFLQ